MKVLMGPDPSEIYRPEGNKNKEDFRNYTSGPLQDRVYNTYKLMHTYQTVDFVRRKHAEFGGFSYKKMSVMEAVDLLEGLVDESDPDVDFPNSFHAFQTAEGIRKAHPDKDWFHLVGLLHDLGKILVLAGEPQWSVVGDTFPVGCRPQKSVVFWDSTFQDNPDTKDPRYCTEYGMYEPHCGLEKVLMSWGHDGPGRVCGMGAAGGSSGGRGSSRLWGPAARPGTISPCPEYMYQMMKFNKFSLPPEAFYMIRFHSFYPWHTGGDYRHLCSTRDLDMLPWVQEFNKFDLYTKSEDLPDVSELRPYYQGLIDKYCPGILCW
ncbi:inositol oxygenase isoform X1 [Gracilinanus agilis]|uniref:inositol oxygenase isoform X1 n=1 Tax=Gracilinanus agilis TaxID=191870 RepID=UPI001CFE7A86|nr:inositol oxygenase isoform X1 [Gracilinanus agilis]